MDDFDAQEELLQVREERKALRRRRRSRLTRFESQLLAMRKQGATYGDLRHWLRNHHVKADETTISRFLRRHYGDV